MNGSIRDLGLRPEGLQQPAKPAVTGQREDGSEKSFGQALENALREVDQSLNAADQDATNFVVGKGGDLHNVMIELEKADLQFRTIVQVRNKLLEAYKEVMRMQV
ncbi:MAG TPA: flagellar hook-basal body complex protein FliE [Acidobacteria bacterium]|nr:flagellar hook-basal body complex protein FliE [Acidobacteriota bacterium]